MTFITFLMLAACLLILVSIYAIMVWILTSHFSIDSGICPVCKKTDCRC